MFVFCLQWVTRSKLTSSANGSETSNALGNYENTKEELHCTVDDEPTVLFEGVVLFWLGGVTRAIAPPGPTRACDSLGASPELSRLIFHVFADFPGNGLRLFIFIKFPPGLAELAYLFRSGFFLI